MVWVQNGAEVHTAQTMANVMKTVTSCGSDLRCNRCNVDTSRPCIGRSGRRRRHSEQTITETAASTSSGHNQATVDTTDTDS